MSQTPEARSSGLIKSQLDLGGGLFLLGLAAVGLAGGFNLPTGTLSGIGSGLMPRAVSVLVAAFGALLVVQSFLLEGDRLERWHLRGPVFILGAVLVFALLIRGSTLTLGGFLGIPLLATIKIPGLGLIIAGPLSVIVSAYADRDTRFLEVLWFSVVMTLVCGLMFKDVLNLPIPYDPLGLIPEPIDAVYAAIKSGFGHVFDFVKSFFAS
jgi:putative tricarboxylic transport membrane protein